MLNLFFFPGLFLLCNFFFFLNIKINNKYFIQNFKLISLQIIYVVSPLKFIYSKTLVGPLSSFILFFEQVPCLFRFKTVYRFNKLIEIVVVRFKIKTKIKIFRFLNEFFLFFMHREKNHNNIFKSLTLYCLKKQNNYQFTFALPLGFFTDLNKIIYYNSELLPISTFSLNVKMPMYQNNKFSINYLFKFYLMFLKNINNYVR